MYPHIQGLQEVALGMVLPYSIAKSEFIQIMNTGKHHWVTVSNITCNDEEIHVYDCASGCPTNCLLNQIASIVCTPKDITKLTYIDVQMQQACDDCGLHANIYMLKWEHLVPDQMSLPHLVRDQI